MKIAVIGCTHAGTAAIKNMIKLYQDADITVYERNDNISFLSCGIALYVGGVVKDPKGLFYSSPEELAKDGVKTFMKHDVVDVDFDKKELKIKNLENNEIKKDNYDKLIITTGSWPVIPNIEGIDLDNIQLSKNYYHSNKIIEKSKKAENIVVVGAGYIGVELAEAFEQMNKNVTLIDAEKTILPKYLDKEFTDIAQNSMENHGINLALGEKVQKFEGEKGKVSKVITNKGEYKADMVIMSVGFKPNTELFKGKLEMLENGAIKIDEYMRTSENDVFAAGDCCTVIYNPLKKHQYIPLATNAIRMGTLVARNLKENRTKYIGTQGTSGIKIYENNIASTGLTEERAKNEKLDVESVLIEENNRPEFMPSYDKITIKMVYNKNSKEILGAQIMSNRDHTEAINTISVAIQNKMTVDELAFTDFFFQPHYNKPWNYLNSVALEALE
jgi:NADPH-dependent 2,4-dienoyl-CoA reductase/sulfur reductase-like enzyme